MSIYYYTSKYIGNIHEIDFLSSGAASESKNLTAIMRIVEEKVPLFELLVQVSCDKIA